VLTKTITPADNQVTIKGITESSQVDNIQLTASLSGTEASDTEAFSVVAVQKVEWVNEGQLDANPHPVAPVGVRIFLGASEPGVCRSIR